MKIITSNKNTSNNHSDITRKNWPNIQTVLTITSITASILAIKMDNNYVMRAPIIIRSSIALISLLYLKNRSLSLTHLISLGILLKMGKNGNYGGILLDCLYEMNNFLRSSTIFEKLKINQLPSFIDPIQEDPHTIQGALDILGLSRDSLSHKETIDKSYHIILNQTTKTLSQLNPANPIAIDLKNTREVVQIAYSTVMGYRDKNKLIG